MRAENVAVLFLLVIQLAAAGLDQSYTQAVARDGTSTVEKTMELAVFANQLTPEALGRMDTICRTDPRFDCDVDVAGKKITIRETLPPGGYYSFSSDYGLPDVTYTLVVNSVPSDRFSSTLDRLLVEADVTEESGSAGNPINLRDKDDNNETVFYSRFFDINITYIVTMPVDITEAHAGAIEGEISGKSVRFNLVDVLAEAQPITVKGTELNMGYIVGIVGIILIVGLALLFLAGRKPEVEKPHKKKK